MQAGETEDKKCYTPEKRAQRMELCNEENREGSLCPWSVDSQELFRKVKTCQPSRKKVLAVHYAQVQRRGTLYNKRNHQAVGLPSAGLGLRYRCSDPLREQESVQHLDGR